MKIKNVIGFTLKQKSFKIRFYVTNTSSEVFYVVAGKNRTPGTNRDLSVYKTEQLGSLKRKKNNKTDSLPENRFFDPVLGL